MSAIRYVPRSRPRPAAYEAAVRWYRDLPAQKRLRIVRRVGRCIAAIVAYRLGGGR